MADQKKEDQKPRQRPGMSRRGFMKGVGAGAVATGVLPPLLKAAPANLTGPGTTAVKLMINGRERALTIEPRVTLLDALRNHLDMTGAKKVCDRTACGACTVLMDGRVVYACSVLAIEAQGSRIETVENLSANGQMHALQKAFVDHDAQQCGFCTPGFVMAAKGLLDKTPAPTRDQIHTGLSGNTCRCGTYAGMTQAVLDAAAARGGRTNG